MTLRAPHLDLAVLFLFSACSGGDRLGGDDPPDAAARSPDAGTRPELCAKPGDDAVRDLFCKSAVPSVTSLQELLTGLRFAPDRKVGTRYSDSTATSTAHDLQNGIQLTLTVSLLAHSSALFGEQVSQINPRAILMAEETMIAFQRGVQKVELATRSRSPEAFEEYNFYLLTFRQACNRGACDHADMYSDRIESGWLEVQLQDDEELKNTVLDCRQCHQRGLDEPILLMRELDGPWLHFFGQDRAELVTGFYPEPNGRDLVLDYRAAKGDEGYATLPIEVVRGTTALSLETRITKTQPLILHGNQTLNERWPYQEGVGWSDMPQRSPSWDRAFAAFQRGEQLALPYYAVRATDPRKLAAVSDAYRRFQRGELAAAQLPDLADVFSDDPTTRAELGLQNLPGASGADALIQTCGACHNDVLDPTISRARFSVDLARMSASERDLAVQRLRLPADDSFAMPPRGVRQLDSTARATLIAYLQDEARTPDDDARLHEAAVLGMAVVPPDSYRAE